MVRVGGWPKWVDTVAHHLAKHSFELAKRSFKVTAFVFDSATAPVVASDGVEVVHETISEGMCGKASHVAESGRRLRAHLARGRYDVVYVMDSWSIPAFWYATLCTMRWGRAYVVYQTFEWLDPNVHGWWSRRLERRLCRRADLVINIDRVRGRAQQMLYELSAPPLWVRNSLPCDYALPPWSDARRRELLGEGAPADAVVVFSPSVAAPERLARELVEAVAGLPEKYRLAMVAGHGAYFGACVAAAKTLGAGARVRFLPRMPFDEMMKYVVCADVGVVLHDAASRSFGDFVANPMRLSMFCASGIPVVAADLPTVAGDVYRYGLGVCCDGPSPESIRRALLELECGHDQLHEQRAAIRRTFAEHWCFEREAGRLVEALVRGVAQSRRSP